ncbi:MAG: tetraacyldisaccharide 4'-kinase, partial [bacterium]|nr:tetraacyldisaccharide 4'-kinase [bacterium]
MTRKISNHFLKMGKGEKDAPVALDLFLSALSLLYIVIVKVRQFIYDKIKKKKHLSAAVISVGNITVGGTGKTPFVIMLA